jgi:hypothetical protein
MIPFWLFSSHLHTLAPVWLYKTTQVIIILFPFLDAEQLCLRPSITNLVVEKKGFRLGKENV